MTERKIQNLTPANMTFEDMCKLVSRIPQIEADLARLKVKRTMPIQEAAKYYYSVPDPSAPDYQSKFRLACQLLSKRCQRGSIPHAHKVGKFWYVPMP